MCYALHWLTSLSGMMRRSDKFLTINYYYSLNYYYSYFTVDGVTRFPNSNIKRKGWIEDGKNVKIERHVFRRKEEEEVLERCSFKRRGVFLKGKRRLSCTLNVLEHIWNRSQDKFGNWTGRKNKLWTWREVNDRKWSERARVAGVRRV